MLQKLDRTQLIQFFLLLLGHIICVSAKQLHCYLLCILTALTHRCVPAESGCAHSKRPAKQLQDITRRCCDRRHHFLFFFLFPAPTPWCHSNNDCFSRQVLNSSWVLCCQFLPLPLAQTIGRKNLCSLTLMMTCLPLFSSFCRLKIPMPTPLCCCRKRPPQAIWF